VVCHGGEEVWLKGGIVSRVVHLSWTVAAGAAAYFAALTLFGVRIQGFSSATPRNDVLLEKS